MRSFALKTAPASTPCQRASGSSSSIRSAANHEYGDIAPKKKSGCASTAAIVPEEEPAARADRSASCPDPPPYRVCGVSNRVLLLSWEYPPVIEGGLARHVRKLAEALVRQGVAVDVLTRGNAEAPSTDVSAPEERAA